MTREEAIEVLKKTVDNSVKMTMREWEEFDKLLVEAVDMAIEALNRPKGKWVMDENPHDGDCRCSVCGITIDQMHERNHGILNELTGGKWWTFYKFCPKCGAKMKGGEE